MLGLTHNSSPTESVPEKTRQNPTKTVSLTDAAVAVAADEAAAAAADAENKSWPTNIFETKATVVSFPVTLSLARTPNPR